MSYISVLLLSVTLCLASTATLPQTANTAIVFEPQSANRNHGNASTSNTTAIRSNYYYDEESKKAAGFSGSSGTNNAPAYNPAPSEYERSTAPSRSHVISGNHGMSHTPQPESYGSNNPVYLNSPPNYSAASNYPENLGAANKNNYHNERPVSNSYSNPSSIPYQNERPVTNSYTNPSSNIPVPSSSKYSNQGSIDYQRPIINPLQLPSSNTPANTGNLNNNYNNPSQVNSGSQQYQYERPASYNTGGNYNPPSQLSGGQQMEVNNKYPILVSSSNQPEIPKIHPSHQTGGPYEKTDEPSYAFERPEDSTTAHGTQECVCVLESHCPLLSTRIVTPEMAPCDRASDVRCCMPDTNAPPSRCGIRMNITLQDGATRPGQARFGEHPWSVVLLSQDDEYIGGGALLDDMHVLTAAHKVHQYVNNFQGMKVRLGEWDAASNHEPYSYLEYAVNDVQVYPEFNAKNLHGDVAVVSFEGSVELRRYPHINSACLPRQGELFIGHKCWVAGWGQDAFGKEGAYQRVLKHVDVPVVPADECEARLRDTKLSQYFHLDRRSFICAGGEPQKDACTGDGGSPLVCQDPEHHQFYIAGLVAWGIGCASHGIPGVYVNVAGYSEWITEQTTNFKHLKY